MPDLSDLDLGRRARRLRVDTLVRLRWLAIAGQSAAVLGTYFGLRFNLPIALCVCRARTGLPMGRRRRCSPSISCSSRHFSTSPAASKTRSSCCSSRR
jgi:hypothetical protein